MRTQTLVNRVAFHRLIGLFTKVSEATFILTKPLGKGYVQIFDLEQGLQVRFWNCCFYEAMDLYNDVSIITEAAYFTLAFFLNLKGLLFSHGGESLKESIIWDTIFISNACNYRMYMLPKAKGHCLGISFSKKWLRNNVFQNEMDFEPLEEKIDAVKMVAIHEWMDAATKIQVEELMDNTWKNKLGSFYIKSYVLKLLSDFLYRVKRKNLRVNNLSIFNPINEIEKYLIDNIKAPLPQIKVLAELFLISPSTLTRRFKKVHGDNISTYFIRKKMEYAKQLLNDGSRSLEEISCMLGYKSASYFKVMYNKYVQ